jgi:hypothetical protein
VDGPAPGHAEGLAGRRHIVCRNDGEGCCRSGFDRNRTLERQLAKGDKALVGNTSYRRYLTTRTFAVLRIVDGRGRPVE